MSPNGMYSEICTSLKESAGGVILATSLCFYPLSPTVDFVFYFEIERYNKRTDFYSSVETVGLLSQLYGRTQDGMSASVAMEESSDIAK